jgi:23S rRNA pseudouridine2605 synthase
MPEERLQRALARAGYGSRRACEELIRQGRVSIDGREAALGDRVDPARTDVRVDGVRIPVDPDHRYFALHKPTGVTTTMRDPHAARDLSSFLPPGPRVFPVGRLDRDTEGLLLLTNDGELANRLQHPRYGIEKEYLAEVDGAPTNAKVSRLLRGVDLEDGPASARRATVAARAGARAAVKLVMVEGRKREVRRMLDAVGLPVRRLVRVRVGPVKLGRLRAGEVRELDADEVRVLYQQTGM